jgi:hypothetical protein
MKMILLPSYLMSQHTITIDGNFDDWAAVPVAVADSADDVHDTDGDYPDDGAPEYVEYSDVDILEVKFTNDAENLYGYIKATGEIGRTSIKDQPVGSKDGRYYFIFTIDVDDNDTTGYRLKNGGYYPDSYGYDMNMEVEFYNGAFNTGHYINHEYISEADLDSNGVKDLEDQVVRLAPGTYDYYTQWVTFPDSSWVLVSDRGPVQQGIITIAVSADGHEAEIKAPMWGFLWTPEGERIVDIGYTIDVSASLEGSGELSEQAVNLGYTNGSKSVWGSDTAEPFSYTVVEPATSIALDSPKKSTLPSTPVLHTNFPNPFNPQTTISYDLPDQAFVRVTIYDILGREIITLIEENQASGYHQTEWNGEDVRGNIVSSGVYLYQLKIGFNSLVQKMVLSR